MLADTGERGAYMDFQSQLKQHGCLEGGVTGHSSEITSWHTPTHYSSFSAQKKFLFLLIGQKYRYNFESFTLDGSIVLLADGIFYVTI